jgi:RND family efflux transporter MFP subunit
MRLSLAPALLVPLALATAAACNPTEAARSEGPRQVLVETAERTELVREHRYSSVVRAARRASLGFGVGGRLAARPVSLGDRVEAGQLLARLDDRQLGHAVRAAGAGRDDASARLAQLERDRDRALRLVAARAAGAEELEKIEATLSSARAAVSGSAARLGEARRVQAEARIEAPFAGTVSEVLLEPGELASPGQPVVILSGSGGLEVEIEVPESLRTALREGQAAAIELPLAGLEARGVIRHLATAAPRPGRLFPVVVALDATDAVVPGLTAEVILTTRTEAALSVPIGAILDPAGGGPFVFVVEGDRVEAVAVEVIRVAGGKAQVSGPLGPGDRVAVAGHANLIAGEMVSPKPAGGAAKGSER